jgi:hypothetical protein
MWENLMERRGGSSERSELLEVSSKAREIEQISTSLRNYQSVLVSLLLKVF